MTDQAASDGSTGRHRQVAGHGDSWKAFVRATATAAGAREPCMMKASDMAVAPDGQTLHTRQCHHTPLTPSPDGLPTREGQA